MPNFTRGFLWFLREWQQLTVAALMALVGAIVAVAIIMRSCGA